MNQIARREPADAGLPESSLVTPAARELVEGYPRWPLVVTLAVVVVLAGVASWLVPALI